MSIFSGLISGSSIIIGSTGYFSGSVTASGFFGTASRAVTASYVIPTGLPAGTVSSSGQVNGANITNNSVSYTAGAGLSGGGAATLGGGAVTIDAVAGAGISLTAPTNDAININTGSAHFVTGARATISSTDTTGAGGINLRYNNQTGIISGSLVNSSVTVNGTAISLGGSGTVTANTTNALTLGNGLTGTSFNGSTAVTTTVDTSSTHFTNGVKTKMNTDGVISSSAQQVVASYTNASDNRILTSVNTNTINAEQNLTFDGNIFAVNTNHLYVSASNVGIGTTSPGAKLQVDGATIVNGANLRVYLNGAESVSPHLYIANSANNEAYNWQPSATGNKLYLWTYSATDRASWANMFTFTALGNFGIGTTSPASTLTVSGSDNSDATGAGTLRLISPTGNLRFGNTSTYSWIQSHNSRPLYINELGNNVIINSNGGSVGIGTTSPLSRLAVAKTSLSATPSLGTQTNNHFAVLGDSAAYGVLVGVLTSGDVYQQVGRVDALATAYNLLLNPLGGNVGIGTTSPGTKLHVQGMISASAIYRTFQNYAGTTNNPVKTWDGVLVAGSDNGVALAYTIIDTGVPQDSYMMGGFTIEWFESYDSTNAKTSIRLGGYWNPESNGGFIGWEYNTTNPYIAPTIQVGRNSSTGNTAFILSHFNSSYPIIVARDLWLGYNAGASTYGEGWSISQASSTTGYTNLDTVIPRYAAAVDQTMYIGTTAVAINRGSAALTVSNLNINTQSDIGGIRVSTAAAAGPNSIRFYGLNGDGAGSYNHAAIIERLWGVSDQSELLIYKGNDPDSCTNCEDQIRIGAAGRIVFHSPDGFYDADQYLTSFPSNRTGSMYINGNTVYIPNTNGTLGIATTSPQSRLHVAGTVSYGTIRISPTSANGESAIAFFTDTAGTDTNDAWVVGHAGWSNTGDFVIGNENNGAGGNVRLLIEKAGNVGINTTSPGYKLDVNGTVFGNGIYSNNWFRSIGDTGWYSEAYGGGIYMIDGTYVRVYNSKGFLVSGFHARVDYTGATYIANDTTSTTDAATSNYITFQRASVEKGWIGYGDGSGGLFRVRNSIGNLRIDASGEVQLWTNSTQQVTVNTSGNVGINTTSPQKKLDVVVAANDFASVGTAQMSPTQWAGIHFGYREANTSYRKSAIVFERTDLTEPNAQGKVHILNGPQSGGGSATLSDAKLTIAENGNVGIGATSPNFRLDVQKDQTKTGDIETNSGQFSIGGSTTVGKRMVFGYDTNSNGFGYIKAGNYGVAWTNIALQPDGGNVSIGNTTFGYKLHVSGDIYTTNLYNDAGWYRYMDTQRDAGNSIYYPNAATRAVRYFFATGGSTDSPGANYSGVLQFNPWDGTTASTGDASYQLAFSSTSTHGSGYPTLRIRKGIDTTWNTWYRIPITNGDFVWDFANSRLGIGTTGPVTLLHIQKSSGTYTTPDNNTVPGIYVYNSSNSSAIAHAYLALRTNSANGGDPFISFDIAGVTGWSMGIDNSDSDRFIISSQWDGLGTNNELRLDSSGNLVVAGDVTAYGTPSDISFKTNIQPLENALASVLQLRGVTFDWKEDTDPYEMTNIKEDIGFIAQEVQAIIPEIVRQNENGKLSIRDRALFPLLVEAIKELNAKIDKLEQRG